MWAKQKQAGFTIVELLIVIVIIAILAAITIVAYNGIQDRAKNAAAQSAAAQAAKKLQAYAVLNNDQYPATLADADIQNSDGSLQYTNKGAGFCVTATAQNVSYFQQNSTQATKGACEGHGVNGVPPLTNLILNPKLGTNASGWASIQSTNGASTGGRISGLSSLDNINVTTAYRTTLTAAPDSWWRVQYSQPTPVTAGTTYTLSGYIRPSVATTSAVIIIWMNSSNGTISESSTTGGHSANNWGRRSVTATAPAGAVSARFHFGATGGGVVNATLDASAAMFTQTSNAPAYADGDAAGWAWTGTANASTSTGPPL